VKVTLGKIKLTKTGKGKLTVSRKIRVDDRLVVSDGLRDIVNSKVTVIESRLGTEASIEPAPSVTGPTPSPTPSATPPVSGGGQSQNPQTRTGVSALISTTPSVSARSQLSSSLQTTAAITQRNSMTYSLTSVPHDLGRDLVATATVVTAGTDVANSPPEVRKIEIRGDLAIGDTFYLSGLVDTDDTQPITGSNQAELLESLVSNLTSVKTYALKPISSFEEDGKTYLRVEWSSRGARATALLLKHRAGRVNYRKETQIITLNGNLEAGDVFTLVADGFTVRAHPIQGTTQAELTTDLVSKLVTAHGNAYLSIISSQPGQLKVVFNRQPLFDAPDAVLTQNVGQRGAVGETQTLTLDGNLEAGDEFSLVANGRTIQSGPIQGADQAALASDLGRKLFNAKTSAARIAFISDQGVDQNGFRKILIEYTTAAGDVPDASLTQTVGQKVAAGEEQTLTLSGNLATGDEFSLVADGYTIQSGPLQGANQAELTSDLASKLNAANPGGSTIASISSQGAGVLKIVFTLAAGDVSDATLTHTRVAG
jgi:hypothetical protein